MARARHAVRDGSEMARGLHQNSAWTRETSLGRVSFGTTPHEYPTDRDCPNRASWSAQKDYPRASPTDSFSHVTVD